MDNHIRHKGTQK